MTTEQIKTTIWMQLTDKQRTKACEGITIDSIGSYEGNFKFFNNILKVSNNSTLINLAKKGLKFIPN